MNIGFIGFGEVNKKLAEILKDKSLLTSKENRSTKTIENIEKSKIKQLPTFKEVAINSDIIFSATSPNQAISTAEKYGLSTYVDLNNISPDTAIKISKKVENFIDAAIIGNINNDFTLFLSGPNAEELYFLNSYLPVKIISNEIGDASRLKLLRSIYTKGLSAILIEVSEIAESFNIKDTLLDTIAITEGDNFKKSAISRITNTKSNSKRKEEELLEILEYFKKHDLEMTKATFKKLSNI